MSGSIASLTTLGGLSGAAQGLAAQAGQALGVQGLGAALGIGGGWRAQLRPASFRGVPFYVDSHDQEAGRHVALHEYPLREQPSTEDMGRRAEQFRVRAYVIGDPSAPAASYLDAAAALYQACARSGAPGRLVHPYLGELTCRCPLFRRTERKDRGNVATFDLLFVEAGTDPSPTATPDTASSCLSMVGQALAAARNLYALAMAVAHNPGFLLGFAESQLGGLVDAFLGLPAGSAESLLGLAFAIAAAPADPVATGAAVTAALSTYADTVAQSVAGTYDPGADLSYGLLSLASYGDPAAAITGAPPSYATLFPAAPVAGLPATATPAAAQQSVNQAALVALVQSSALAATAQVYAQTIFVSANAAGAARDTLVGAIDALAVTVADAGWFDLYAALVALAGAVVVDMTTRAQQLPILGAYATPDSLPSLALAWRLYQDATRADELVALNDAVHPLFMPPSGVALTS